MTLNQLRYFVKVAENGHLTRSAAELMIAQPSLSQAIGKLEKELGFPLFSSKGRTLILTKEGQIFLPYAKNVITVMIAKYIRIKCFISVISLPLGNIPNMVQNYIFYHHKNIAPSSPLHRPFIVSSFHRLILYLCRPK